MARPGSDTKVLTLTRRIARRIREGHPWIYREALSGSAAPGRVVTVVDEKRRFVGRGLAGAGPIGVRVWTAVDEPLDAELVATRLAAAAAARDRVVPPETDAYRLVHGEGDRLPGIVVDAYGNRAVLKFDDDGAATMAPAVIDALGPLLRSRAVEHLYRRSGRRGETRVTPVGGAPPPGRVTVNERGMRLVADLARGQKTGLFLDHRQSRHRVRALAAGARVLNLYGYTGGFSVAAGLGGAEHVVTVDVAAPAIELATETWSANGLDSRRHDAVAADALEYLAAAGKRSARFDLVVADPPSFAPNEKSLARALRAYRTLHERSLALVPDGGLYLAASCSSHVDRERFRESLREGARRAGRVLTILEEWGAPADHPRLLAFPEGDYLKVILTRVVR